MSFLAILFISAHVGYVFSSLRFTVSKFICIENQSRGEELIDLKAKCVQ